MKDSVNHSIKMRFLNIDAVILQNQVNVKKKAI